MADPNFLDLYKQALQDSTAAAPGAGGISDLQKIWAEAAQHNVKSGAPVQPPSAYSYPGGFGRSAIQSIPELFGIEPSQPVQQWRAENPVGSFGSQILGAVGPYGAGALAGRAAASRFLPNVWKALAPAAEFGKAHPIASAALRLGLELTPFELARIGSAAAIGDQGTLDDVALSAGLDLALTPIIPAAFAIAKSLRAPAAADAGRALQRVMPEFDPMQPPQVQLSKLYDLRSKAGPDLIDFVDAAIVDRERIVRTEGIGESKYVGQMWDGSDAKAIKRLFKATGETPESGINRRRFMESPTIGFGSRGEWEAEMARAGLPEDWPAFTQYPRHISFRKDSSAAEIQNVIGKNLRAVHKGWYMEPEADTGLFVMAKKLEGGPTPSALDKWLMFKTSQPNKVLGEDYFDLSMRRSIRFTNQLERGVNRAALETLVKEIPDSLVAVGRGFRNAVPKTLMTEAGLTNAGRLRAMMPKGWQNAANEMQPDVAAAWQYLKRFVSPGMTQFRGKPLAEWVRIGAGNVFDAARAKANLINYGEQGLKPGESALRAIFKNKGEAGGIEGSVFRLKDEDMPFVTRMRNAAADLEDIQSATRNMDALQRDRIREFFKNAAEVDATKIKEIQRTQELYGVPVMEPLPGHYGISHTWSGDWRQRVIDERGRTVAMASGRSPAEATSEAARLSERFGGAPKDRPFLSDAEEDVKLSNMLLRSARLPKPGAPLTAGAPRTFEDRLDVAGFAGQERPLTRRELADIMTDNVQRAYKYLAELQVKHDLSPEILQSGAQYGREVLDQLVGRINQMAGKPGIINKMTSRAVDRVLAPVMGKNSAQKIVYAYNAAETHLQLMAFNLGFPAINAFTFVQTMLPKIALLRSGTPERLVEFMGFMPDIGPQGPKGALAFLEPMKIAKSGFDALRRPSLEQTVAFNRAAQDGVIAPRYVEEWMGEKSIAARSIKQILQTETNAVPKLIRRVSEYLPAKIEEMTRAHAFMTGDILARKILGIADEEQIYQFARQFTFRTMYQYQAADRPKIMAGPIGGLFGLFKNWSFHYLADMSRYSGEAFLRNNWAPLTWAVGGTGAIAGVGGLPGYAVADAFSKIATDKSLMQNLYSAFGHNDEGPSALSDATFYGLPAFLGVSLQGSAAAPLSNPQKDINYLFNFALLERARKVGKLFSYAMNEWGTGVNPFEYDRTWDLAAYAFAPRSMYKAFSQVEDGALKAIGSGQPIVGGITGAEQALNALGLTPLKIARAYALSEELWTDQQKVKALTTQYGESYAQAWAAGDQQAMQAILARATAVGVDIGKMMSSASVRFRHGQQESLDYSYRSLSDVYERRNRLGL